jgi:N-acetylglucosaminyldiphosphoundecaprenol N-acetyl-beta-D-mannosaminyltransferase
MGFGHQHPELAAVTERLAQARPGIVYVGLGFPKQERVIAALSAALPDAWFIGCGAAIPFAAGTLPRAPQWMQRTGLEWLHRLMSEPRRLLRRYLVDDLPFAIRLLITSALAGQIRRGRTGAGGPAQTGLTTRTTAGPSTEEATS